MADLDQLEQNKPSAAIMAALMGVPVPDDWHQRIAQGQAWRDEALKLIKAAEVERQNGNVDRARDLTAEAASYELAGTLRACSGRQLDALRREQWSELLNSVSEEEYAADQSAGQGGIAGLVLKMIRLILLWVFRIDLDINQPESERRNAVHKSMPTVVEAIDAECRARKQATEVRAATQYDEIDRKNRQQASSQGINLDVMYRAQNLLSGCSETKADQLRAAKVIVKVVAGYVQERRSLTLTGDPEEVERQKAGIVFRVAEQHGLVFSASRKAELFQLLRAQDLRDAETADIDGSHRYREGGDGLI